MVDKEPELPTFFSTTLVLPSPNEKSAAVISPLLSRPEQVRVTVSDALPEVGETDNPVQSGTLLDDGVGVGVGVGVIVRVGVGVTVGVTVGEPMENARVQAGSDALGLTWGTLGATGLVWVSFILVTTVATPKTIVMMVAKIRCQYFFIRLKSFIAMRRLRIFAILR